MFAAPAPTPTTLSHRSFQAGNGRFQRGHPMSEKAHGGASGPTSNPWSYPVVVAKIPEAGLHVSFDADERQRAALAEIGGLREVQRASATFDLFHGRSGAVEVTGR